MLKITLTSYRDGKTTLQCNIPEQGPVCATYNNEADAHDQVQWMTATGNYKGRDDLPEEAFVINYQAGN